MFIEDLFPPCLLENCPNHGDDHRHVLPFQWEFFKAHEKFLALVGGYGSGKTLPACVLGILLSLKVPGNRGLVCRRSYPKLHDPTERIFLDVLQRSGVSFETYESRDGWPHRVILENGSEVMFRETSDLGKFLGPEYGWFYIDEAIEEPHQTFKDLVGRLRLGVAKKYLKGIITTNPPIKVPNYPHWIDESWGEEDGVKVKVAPDGTKASYRLWNLATIQNPFLPKEYVGQLLMTHTPQEVERIIYGKRIQLHQGKPVYPQFQHSKHVGEPPAHLITLCRVWDFGYHCPAVTWHQFVKCKKGNIHWHVLREYVGRDIEAVPLARVVVPMTKDEFPDHPALMILDGGDYQGLEVTDKGPGAIIQINKVFKLQFRVKKFPNMDPGLDTVRDALRGKCSCGHPFFLVHRNCTGVIGALGGGYHYPERKIDKPMTLGQEKPVKDGYFDNIADTIRMAGQLFYVPACRDPDFLRMLSGEMDKPKVDLDDWAWVDEAMPRG